MAQGRRSCSGRRHGRREEKRLDKGSYKTLDSRMRGDIVERNQRYQRGERPGTSVALFLSPRKQMMLVMKKRAVLNLVGNPVNDGRKWSMPPPSLGDWPHFGKEVTCA